MPPVDFDKRSCNPVEFRGQEPRVGLETGPTQGHSFAGSVYGVGHSNDDYLITIVIAQPRQNVIIIGACTIF